jgi:hypothetical protein
MQEGFPQNVSRFMTVWDTEVVDETDKLKE